MAKNDEDRKQPLNNLVTAEKTGNDLTGQVTNALSFDKQPSPVATEAGLPVTAMECGTFEDCNRVTPTDIVNGEKDGSEVISTSACVNDEEEWGDPGTPYSGFQLKSPTSTQHTADLKPIKPFEVPSELTAISLASNGRILIGATQVHSSPKWEATVWLWPDADAAPSRDNSIAGKSSPNGAVRFLYFLDELGNKVIIGYDNAMLEILVLKKDLMYYLESEEMLHGHTGLLTSSSLSPDRMWLLTGARDCSMKLWSMSNYLLIRNFRQAHLGVVTAVSFRPEEHGSEEPVEKDPLRLSPPPKEFASCSLDGLVCLWSSADASSCSAVLADTFQHSVYKARPTALAWLDLNHLLIGLESGIVVLLVLDSGNQAHAYFGLSVAPVTRILPVNQRQFLVVVEDESSSVLGDVLNVADEKSGDAKLSIRVVKRLEKKHRSRLVDLVVTADQTERKVISCGWDGQVIAQKLD
ncbi:unnamed protein product [Cyprideis torosa]|uniref:Uncharacterized protein n=1 Tax=Cyprideis torosa TaxID=163714 RepID=A0A7R8W6G3_9CRUS|nr:unnamed protein product [Cyprideis torosa]CAG0886403.1 unnamed protein product [Cyprideis torosa]